MLVTLDSLTEVLSHAVPFSFFNVGGIFVHIVILSDHSVIYRVHSPGFAFVDATSIFDAVSVVSSMYAAEHPLYQPEFDF